MTGVAIGVVVVCYVIMCGCVGVHVAVIIGVGVVMRWSCSYGVGGCGITGSIVGIGVDVVGVIIVSLLILALPLRVVLWSVVSLMMRIVVL